MRSGRRKTLAVLAALATAACMQAVPIGVASASSAPIKIALITSETGIAAAEFQTSPQGFLARIDLQNAEGGIDGHKIDPIVFNDQGSLTTVVTATKQAIADGVIGIVNDTPFFFAAYKYPQEAGIPVTGGSFDGSEWGEQPNTNMFASDSGSVNPNAPVSLGIGKFFKAHGGTVVGSYGYGISTSSTYSANGTAKSAQLAGLKVGVLDTSVPFGSVDFSTEALAAKSAGVNALYGGMDNDSNFALETALEQDGVKLKVVEFPTGYEADIINTPVWKAVQGAYFVTGFRPTSLPNAGTIQMVDALRKYQHRAPSNFPSFNIYESWLGADLMIRGIELAGKDPTSAKVIKALRRVTSYNGNGILPVSLNFKTDFGKGNPETCSWYMKAESKGFVAASATTSCASIVPGSTSKTP
jgi:branched-chain amino acid transport system substrate-binding protein